MSSIYQVDQVSDLNRRGRLPPATSVRNLLLRAVRQTSPSCDEMISACSWRNTPHSCSELFEPLHTDFGYCCVFNADLEHEQ